MEGPPVRPRQFGDKSSVIKHVGNMATAAAGGGGGLSDGGGWGGWRPSSLLMMGGVYGSAQGASNKLSI